MNISLGKLNTLFKKKKGRASLSHELYQPHRDWKIILVVFSCIAFCLAGFSAYLFLKINSGDIFKTTQEQFEARAALDPQKLKETVTRFENKKARLEDLATNPIVAPDPSL